MATRYWDHATFEHGAQYLTARLPEFLASVKDWAGAGLVKPWFERHTALGTVTRWQGLPHISALCQHLAEGLEIRYQTRIERLQREGRYWHLEDACGPQWQAEALLLAMPLPQALELLNGQAHGWSKAELECLQAIRYARTHTALLLLDAPSTLPAPGYLRCDPIEPIYTIVDQQQKGVTQAPCLTVHSGPAFAEAHADEAPALWLPELIAAGQKYWQAEVVHAQGHRWKFAHCLTPHPEPFLAAPQAPLWLAGDAFGPSKIETAWHSGWQAAQAIHQAL